VQKEKDMQNRYVGDVGDFGKYHLLKALCHGEDGGKALFLGVVWYLVPNESHNDDGKHIRYLETTASNLERFRKGDPLLYDTLAEIVKAGKRNVGLIREEKVLPADTAFYEAVLTFDGISNNSPSNRLKRVNYRNEWVRGAIKVTERCDIIFVDPDNGLQVTSVKPHQKTGPKYTFFEELVPFVRRRQSLVIYHHLCRSGPAEVQIKERLEQLKIKLGVKNIYSLLYKRGTLRAFFILPSSEHNELLKDRGIRLTQIAPWNQHFSIIT
jgi:hypothetical protein